MDEFIYNEKECVEYVMFVDLECNDFGRVSEYGIVYVDEFMVIEKYLYVMYIVFNVKGKFVCNKDFVDIVDVVFFGGMIIGVFKVCIMEIIEEFELVWWGIYIGLIGWIGFNGDMELNIVICIMII